MSCLEDGLDMEKQKDYSSIIEMTSSQLWILCLCVSLNNSVYLYNLIVYVDNISAFKYKIYVYEA